jgi:hypothetical protein
MISSSSVDFPFGAEAFLTFFDEAYCEFLLESMLGIFL